MFKMNCNNFYRSEKLENLFKTMDQSDHVTKIYIYLFLKDNFLKVIDQPVQLTKSIKSFSPKIFRQ